MRPALAAGVTSTVALTRTTSFRMIVEPLLPWPVMRLTSTGEVQVSASLGELLEMESPTVSVQHLQCLRRISSRISRLTQDLRDVSRIELGRLSLERQSVSLEEATRALLTEIEPTLGQHPVTLDVEGRVPEVFVDPARLSQILTNLFDNAAKYSGAGSRSA